MRTMGGGGRREGRRDARARRERDEVGEENVGGKVVERAVAAVVVATTMHAACSGRGERGCARII